MTHHLDRCIRLMRTYLDQRRPEAQITRALKAIGAEHYLFPWNVPAGRGLADVWLMRTYLREG